MKLLFWKFAACCLMVVGPSAVFASSEYTYCDGAVAYSDLAHTARDPGRDWICALPTDEAGVRCPRAQERTCVGGNMPGPHDVPIGGVAWFWAQSTASATDVKCTCGCFASDTLLESSFGPIAIKTLAELSKYQNIQLKVRDSEDNLQLFRDSGNLRASDFSVGLEEKKLVVFELENGKVLKVTDSHPVLVDRLGFKHMLRAESIKTTDVLIDDLGRDVSIVSRKLLRLPKNDNSVINVNTKETTAAGHIVLAETMQVGDNVWQKLLQIQKSRLENRLVANNSELDMLH